MDLFTLSGRKWQYGVFLGLLGLILVLMPVGYSSGQDVTSTPSTLPWTTYEDTDPLLVYTGDWQPFPVAGAAGGNLTGTDEPGALLALYFEGTGIRVIYSKGPEGRPFQGLLDSDWAQFPDSYAGTYSYGSVMAFEDLTPGSHNLTVANRDGAVWIEAIQVQGTLLVPPDSTVWRTYADTDPMLVYSKGSWQTYQVAAAKTGSLTGTTDPGAEVMVEFAGIGIRVVYSSGPEGGSFAAKVDGWWEQTADASAASYTYSHLLTFENIPDGPHVLTLTNGGGAIWVEAIQVQGVLLAIPPLVPTPSPLLTSPASTTTLSGTSANAVVIPPGDTSAFRTALGDGTGVIDLSANALYEVSETLNISQNKIINGNGATFQATVPVTLFHINGNVTVEMHELTLKNAVANVSNSNYGGAVDNLGTLLIEDSVIELNTAVGQSETYNDKPISAAGGGAIYNAGGILTIRRTTIQTNQASGGGAIQNAGTLTAECVRFDNNTALYGGAILNVPYATATVAYSRFSGNSSSSWGGGAIYNIDQTYYYTGDYLVNAEHNYWGGSFPVTNASEPSTDTVWAVDFSNYLTADPTIEGNPGYAEHCQVPQPRCLAEPFSRPANEQRVVRKNRNYPLQPADIKTTIPLGAKVIVTSKAVSDSSLWYYIAGYFDPITGEFVAIPDSDGSGNWVFQRNLVEGPHEVDGSPNAWCGLALEAKDGGFTDLTSQCEPTSELTDACQTLEWHEPPNCGSGTLDESRDLCVYHYDRDKAAEYATAYAGLPNPTASPGNNQSTLFCTYNYGGAHTYCAPPEKPLPPADPNASNITCDRDANGNCIFPTDCANFTSIALWYGGLPMTQRWFCAGIPCPTSGTSENYSWTYAGSWGQPNYLLTDLARYVPGQSGPFTTFEPTWPSPSSASKREIVYEFDSYSQNPAADAIRQTQNVWGPDGHGIAKGDIAWATKWPHMMMVVGWGPMLTTWEQIDTFWENHKIGNGYDYSVLSPTYQAGYVPYLVDHGLHGKAIQASGIPTLACESCVLPRPYYALYWSRKTDKGSVSNLDRISNAPLFIHIPDELKVPVEQVKTSPFETDQVPVPTSAP